MTIHSCGGCPYVRGVGRKAHGPELGFCGHPKLTLGDRMGDVHTDGSPPQGCLIRKDPDDDRVASNAPVPAVHPALLPLSDRENP